MDNKNKSTNFFSINLKKFIKDNNMTNKELAEKLGVTPSTITSYINGAAYPRMDKINKLCEIFKITNNELFEDVNSIKYNFDIHKPSHTIEESFMSCMHYDTFDYSNIEPLIKNIKSLYKNGDISNTSVIDLNLIINSFSQLNQLGQAELAKRSNEMTEIGKFKK